MYGVLCLVDFAWMSFKVFPLAGRGNVRGVVGGQRSAEGPRVDRPAESQTEDGEGEGPDSQGCQEPVQARRPRGRCQDQGAGKEGILYMYMGLYTIFCLFKEIRMASKEFKGPE